MILKLGEVSIVVAEDDEENPPAILLLLCEYNECMNRLLNNMKRLFKLFGGDGGGDSTG